MAIRLNFVVEGQTEEAFVNNLLVPYLGAYSVWASVRCVMTKRTSRAKNSGGIPNYARAKNDILNWLREDISDRRFIPYIQLHEFEALLLSDPAKFDVHFLNDSTGIRNLAQLVSEYGSPELIDMGAETSPSKRIIKEIPRYEKQKPLAGPRVAEAIGLPTLRAKCRHFAKWLDELESLT